MVLDAREKVGCANGSKLCTPNFGKAKRVIQLIDDYFGCIIDLGIHSPIETRYEIPVKSCMPYRHPPPYPGEII